MRKALVFLGGVLAAVPALCATARAQETGTPRPVEQMRAPSNALELKLGTGYTQGFGFVGPGRELPDVAGAGIGFSGDIDYRVNPMWSLGVEGQYQEFTAQQNTAARGFAGTIGPTFHFAPYSNGEVWLRLGTGYRALWENDPPGLPGQSIARHGFDFLSAKIGYDLRVSEGVALAPVIGGDINGFFWEGPGNGVQVAQAPASAATFIYAGLQGRFDVGGRRTAPEEPTLAGITTEERKGVTAPQPTTPAPQPAPPPVAQPARTPSVSVTSELVQQCKLHLDNIEKSPKFGFDESELAPGDIEVLNQIADCFTTGPMKEGRLNLVGHTDPRGAADYNMVLGMKRASRVKDYLEQRGVTATRIDATSRGALDARGTDEATWAEDRRVDIEQAR